MRQHIASKTNELYIMLPGTMSCAIGNFCLVSLKKYSYNRISNKGSFKIIEHWTRVNTINM